MHSLLVCDTNGHHQPLTDPRYIEYIRSPDVLYQLIENENNNHLQLIVYICGPDKSTIIQRIQNNANVASIRLCKEHDGPETNPTFCVKVQDTMLTPDSDWEFRGRLTLVKLCRERQRNSQALRELERLREIVQESILTSLSTVQLQQQQQQQNTSNIYPAGEEVI